MAFNYYHDNRFTGEDRYDIIISGVMKGIREHYEAKKAKIRREPIIEQGDFAIHVPPSHVKYLREYGFKVKEWNGKEYV